MMLLVPWTLKLVFGRCELTSCSKVEKLYMTPQSSVYVHLLKKISGRLLSLSIAKHAGYQGSK